MNNFYQQQQPQMGYGMPNQNVGYRPQQTPQYTQPLAIDAINRLKSGGSKAFSLEITEDERDRAICTHKDPTQGGNFSLTQNPDGSQTCYICGETFNLVELAKEEVEQAVANVNDILQSIKTYFLDIPEKVAVDYMAVLSVFNKRIPQLYEMSLNNFNKYDNTLHSNYGQNGFGMLNALMNPSMGMGMQQPMGMPGYGAPNMGMQQPMGVGMPGYGAPNMGMPGYGAPNMGMQQQPQMGYGQMGTANPFVDPTQQPQMGMQQQMQQQPQQQMGQQQQQPQGQNITKQEVSQNKAFNV